MNCLDLPEHILEKTFEHLTYDEVEKLQLVSEGTKIICEQVMKRGIRKAIRTHSLVSKRIEALLSQDQSARENNVFDGHEIILMVIKNQLWALSFLYSGIHNLNSVCCNPGRSLDEIFKILALVSQTREKLHPGYVVNGLLGLRRKTMDELNKLITGE